MSSFKSYKLHLLSFYAIFVPFHWPRAHHVTCQKLQKIMVWSCAIKRKCILLQIKSVLLMRNCNQALGWKTSRSLPWEVRDWLKYENKLGDRMIKKKIRPFPNYLYPRSKSESWCQSFHMKMRFLSHSKLTHFYMNGCGPGLVLITRLLLSLVIANHDSSCFPCRKTTLNASRD